MTWCRTLTIVLATIGVWCTITGTPLTRKLILVAALMSAVWVTWYNYDYNAHDQLKVGRLNVMTWVAWTIGLLAVGIFWIYLADMTDLGLAQRLAITALAWFVSMITIEWIGYNVLNIRLKSTYPGLFGMELMHGPDYLKVYYLSAWALYLALICH